MTRFFQHPWGWTSVAPLVCVAHCLATPVVVAVAPGLMPGARIEWLLLAATVAVAGAAVRASSRTHGELLPFVPVGLGLLVWTAGILHAFHPLPEEPVIAASALTVAVGLLWNSRLRCARHRVPCRAGASFPSEEAVPARP